MKIFRIICAVIIVCMLVGAGFYVKYLHNEFITTVAEKNVTITILADKIASLETTIESLNAELEITKGELDIAQEKIALQCEEIDNYQQQIEDEEAKWQRRYEEYPEATEAWIAMKNLGWSDTVCAGIMGNLMAETGGTGTLHLDWDSNGINGYGLIQWIDGRRTDIKAKYGEYPTIKEQIQFVYDELYGTNGVQLQVTKAQRDKIMNAETPEECAYAFACYYERCHKNFRSMRKGFARTAYRYFTS